MKVEKVAIQTLERAKNLAPTKESQGLNRDSIKEFNDIAGDLKGRAQVLMSNIRKSITLQELNLLKDKLRQTMAQRNFSQKVIDYILSYTNKDNYQVAEALVNDMYAHTSTMTWTIGYTTKDNAQLMLDAILKKNYKAVYDIQAGRINDTSQIKDMSNEVIANGRKYIPKESNLPIRQDVLQKEKGEVIEAFKAKGLNQRYIEYVSSYINNESIEVAKVLSQDKEVSADYIRWVIGYTNSENSELMLRAILNKDYRAVYTIQSGETRLFETLDARYAVLKRIKNADKNEQNLYSSFLENTKINDDNAFILKMLFENKEYDLNYINQIYKNINKDNIQAIEEALRNKDYITIEKLTGAKFKGAKVTGNSTVNSQRNINRDSFITSIVNKIAKNDRKNPVNISQFSEDEIELLAQIIETKPEQIKQMDKKEYRRLCIKWHPDRNSDKQAENIFGIINKLFLSN